MAEQIAEDTLPAALDGFHGKAFSPKLELTQKDIHSLDGRAVRAGAADAIQGLLEKGTDETPAPAALPAGVGRGRADQR
ncbi:MAG: hypothetical protein R3F60_18470 [bacterium]